MHGPRCSKEKEGSGAALASKSEYFGDAQKFSGMQQQHPIRKLCRNHSVGENCEQRTIWRTEHTAVCGQNALFQRCRQQNSSQKMSLHSLLDSEHPLPRAPFKGMVPRCARPCLNVANRLLASATVINTIVASMEPRRTALEGAIKGWRENSHNDLDLAI